MIKQILSVTPAGSTGSATGSASVVLQRGYELEAVYIDFTSVTSDTWSRLELADPASVLLGPLNTTTDGWYFPRKLFNSSTGTSLTGTYGMARYPLVGTLVGRAASSTPTTNGVEFHVYIREA
jgi:hypothetical protein